MEIRKNIREVDTYPPSPEHLEPSFLRLWFVIQNYRTNDSEFLHNCSSLSWYILSLSVTHEPVLPWLAK